MSPDLYQRQYNRILLKTGLIIREIFYQMSEITGNFLLRILSLLLPKNDYFYEPVLPLKKAISSIHHILVIRTDRMGDLILSTPALHALRQGFPQAKIWLLVDEKNEKLVRNNPDLDEVLTYKRNQGLKKDIKFIRQLRKTRFDLVVVMYSSFRWHLVAFLTAASYRYGYQAKGAGFLLTSALKDTRFIQPRHEVETTLDLIRAMNIPVADKRLRIYITEEAKKTVDQFLGKYISDKTKPLVAIHPGSYAPRVRWNTENFARAADMLVRKHKAHILIVGSKEEFELGQKLSNLMESDPINVCGQTDLQELAALLNRCHLFIGNSSGPMHLAAAVGIPTVAIFGNTYPLDSYQRWRPWNEKSVVLHKDVGCVNCLPWACQDMICMKAVTPEDVLQAAGKLLKNTAKGRDLITYYV